MRICFVHALVEFSYRPQLLLIGQNLGFDEEGFGLDFYYLLILTN